jgi:hypothetical protein
MPSKYKNGEYWTPADMTISHKVEFGCFVFVIATYCLVPTKYLIPMYVVVIAGLVGYFACQKKT